MNRRSLRTTAWFTTAAAVFAACVGGAYYVGVVQGDGLGAAWLLILAPVFAFAALTGADG